MRRDRRGFALLVALWLLTTLAVAGVGLAALARSRRLAAANLAESIGARAAAAAGIEEARARLDGRLRSDERRDPWSAADSLGEDTITLRHARVVVVLRDPGAALNLNRASEAELTRLFVALRMDAGDADRLAQAIADWRDSDDLHRARGAERDAYLAAGAAAVPRNAPFQTLDELQLVRGMTAELFARLAPYLTLLGGGQINVNAAPLPVLLTLPGMGEEAAAVLLRYRRQRRVLGNLAELERDLSPSARAKLTASMPELIARAVTETREIAVTSTGSTTGSRVRSTMTGLFVRARDAVFYVWSRTE